MHPVKRSAFQAFDGAARWPQSDEPCYGKKTINISLLASSILDEELSNKPTGLTRRLLFFNGVCIAHDPKHKEKERGGPSPYWNETRAILIQPFAPSRASSLQNHHRLVVRITTTDSFSSEPKVENNTPWE
jgi:hypothetical protein